MKKDTSNKISEAFLDIIQVGNFLLDKEEVLKVESEVFLNSKILIENILNMDQESFDNSYLKALSKKRTCRKRWENEIERNIISQVYRDIYQTESNNPIYFVKKTMDISDSFEKWKDNKSKLIVDIDKNILKKIGIKKTITAIKIDLEIFIFQYVRITKERNQILSDVFDNPFYAEQNLENLQGIYVKDEEDSNEFNLKSLNDYSIRPDWMVDVPFFSPSKSKMPFKKNKETEEHLVNWLVKSEEGSVNLIIRASDPLQLKKTKTLDTVDFQIIDFLTLFAFNQIVDILSTPSFTLNDLRLKIFPEYRTKKIYETIESRLKNIESLRYSLVKKNSDGNETENLSFTFLDSMKIIKHENGVLLPHKDYKVEVRLGHEFLMKFSKSAFIMLYKERLESLKNPISRILSHLVAMDRLDRILNLKSLEFSYSPLRFYKAIGYPKKITEAEKIKDVSHALLEMQSKGFLIEKIIFDGERFIGKYKEEDSNGLEKEQLLKYYKLNNRNLVKLL